jgi:RNA polymerase sigma-B factor
VNPSAVSTPPRTRTPLRIDAAEPGAPSTDLRAVGSGAVARREHADALFLRLAELVPGSREHRAIRERLVEMHLPLVVYFARRYAGRGEPLDDLVQAGALGLVKAVDRFDTDRGVAFSTFAGPTILGEIRRHFRDRTWAVHVNRSLQVRTGTVDRYVRDLTQELGRSPTVAELSARSQLPEEEIVESLQCATSYRAASLQAPTTGDRTLGDLLGAEDSAYDDVELHESLGGLLAKLPERERRLLQLRFYGNMSQVQIADRLGISQMHVSRLLNRILGQLRQELEAGD